MRYSILGATAILLGYCNPASSFVVPQQQQSTTIATTCTTTTTTTTTPPTSTRLHMTLELDGALATFSDFYRSEPFLSAFLTCSVKASAADFLAQSSEQEQQQQVIAAAPQLPLWLQSIIPISQPEQEQEKQQVDVHRNLAFLLYGGLYQGMFLQFLYSMVYPVWFGDAGALRIPLTIVTDIGLFGPLVTLPMAYLVRALLERNDDDDDDTTSVVETLQQGLHKYQQHVSTQDLLTRYWTIWAPAQTINWMLVPEHLRVLFVALISFFWVFLLSTISSNEQDTETASRMTSRQPQQHPVTAITA